LAIGYSGYLRGPVNLRDPCFFGMCITPVAGLQYAKSRLALVMCLQAHNLLSGVLDRARKLLSADLDI
jgi:hypothetical protein